MRNSKKIASFITSIVLAVTLLSGCTDNQQKQTTMKDREGSEFKVPSKVERIISTAPSNTEILVGLGLTDKIIATDTYSSDVETIKESLPKLDFRNPDAEAIIALKPDIIVASGHNKAGDEDPFKAVKESGISVVYIPSSISFEAIYADIDFLAQLTKTEQKGKEIVDGMKKDVEKIKEIGAKITDKKKVYFEISSTPTLSSFGSNTFLDEMITTIGATNIFHDKQSWISPSEESVITLNPDVILTNEAYLDNPVQIIKSRNGWGNITAVQKNAVYLLDKNSTSRPSQNCIKALKQMAKAVYPTEYAAI